MAQTGTGKLIGYARVLAFSKLKTLSRKAAARTYNELWQALGPVCDLLTDEKCYTFFMAAGHSTDNRDIL
jgi:hypothetical protein